MPTIFLRFLVTLLACAAGLLTAAPLRAEGEPLQPPQPPQPPYVVERQVITIFVRADASAVVERHAVRRVETPRGAALLARYRRGFRSALANLRVLEAYSVRPDGTRLDVLAEGIRTVDHSDEAEDVYSDRKRLVVIYPGLEPGSTVHLKSHEDRHTPSFPGHFSLRVDAPSAIDTGLFEVHVVHEPGIALRVSSRRFDGGRVEAQAGDPPGAIRYAFRRRQGETYPAGDDDTDEGGNELEPAVHLTSFADYAEVGRAYGVQALPRAEPSAEVAEQARRIVDGASDDLERLRRLRAWINRHVRYLAVYSGVGGWVPHAAHEVLERRYGDCKDQTTLLGAMLRAVGIHSTPVLVDTDGNYHLPRQASSEAFNHVILHVPALDLYVDPTDRFGPLGTLPSPLHGKPAVVVASGQLVRLPMADPERDFTDTELSLRLDSSGEVHGQSKTRFGGAEEGGSREARRRSQGESADEVVNELLARFDETGTGLIQNPDPLDLTQAWVVSTKFRLDPVIDPGQPSALRMPVGLTRADLRQFASWIPGETRASVPACPAGRHRETVSLELPESVRLAQVPQGVEASSGGYRYQSSWVLEGRTLTVTRELSIRRDKPVCNEVDAEHWRVVRPAIRRDLLAPLLLNPV